MYKILYQTTKKNFGESKMKSPSNFKFHGKTVSEMEPVPEAGDTAP